ncbi:hypothetical protein CC80DRAFT_424872 [Byssothecium circinans]|uniref:Uncharacterized protein n=1 Tax=Byssothecium circinans TaxID=147558 RepID=A0A6A5TFC6_9PLEO|nr:hypothetical protein CC80DRAFT_424872 [Byssothecium circinans]
MHSLSESRNPLFEVPDRHRTIRALQLSRLLKEENHLKPWQAVKSMIDRLIDEQGSRQSSQSGAPPLTYSNAPQTTTSLPLNGLHAYPQPVNSYPRTQAPQSIMAPVEEPQPQPQILPQLHAAEQMNSHWNDINFDNIIGGMPADGELPEFDFGFWGDPINFGSEPVNFPMNGGYCTSWPG